MEDQHIIGTCSKCGDETWDGMCTNCQAYELSCIRCALKVPSDADLEQEARKLKKALDSLRELLHLDQSADVVQEVGKLKDERDEAREKVRVLREFGKHSEQMNGKFIYAVDKIREHYNEDWALKGDGKWRIEEFTKWHRHMWDAYREALDADEATSSSRQSPDCGILDRIADREAEDETPGVKEQLAAARRSLLRE